jgi:hypothetical protein
MLCAQISTTILFIICYPPLLPDSDFILFSIYNNETNLPIHFINVYIDCYKSTLQTLISTLGNKPIDVLTSDFNLPVALRDQNLSWLSQKAIALADAVAEAGLILVKQLLYSHTFPP